MSVRLALTVIVLASAAHPAMGQSVARMHSEQCEGGDLRSCSVLGLIYQSGAAGVRDLGRAIELYERACAREVAAACTRVELSRDGDAFDDISDGLHRVGRVADAEDGAPIDEAIVDLPRLGIRAISDDAGRVDLGRLPEGLLTIVTRRAGFQTTRGELPVPWETEFLILLNRTAAEDPFALGRIFGQVRVADSDIALPDVAITVLGPTDVHVVSNQQGRFNLAGLEPGTVELELTRLGYETRRTIVEIQPGRTVEVYAEMSQQAIELEPIEVIVGSSYLDRSGFYARARTSRGATFTRRDVVESDPVVLSDLLWRTPGVTPRRGPMATQVLSRRPTAGGNGEGTCRLRPYLDGVPMWDWDVDLVRPDDLQAMEVYQGTATPVQYRQPADPDGTPACGVVLIWTRRND